MINEILSLLQGDPWKQAAEFDPAKCNCGMPSGFHEGDCMGYQ